MIEIEINVIDERQKVLDRAFTNSYRYWNRLVRERTETSRDIYRKGMYYEKGSDYFVLGVRGLATMFEQGFRPYSIKRVMLKGGVRYKRVPISDDVIRTVSRKRGTARWYHPGFRGHTLLKEVERFILSNLEKWL